jgi:hypothetical protein
MDLTLCPECGALAEVQWRDVVASTDVPVELAKIMCVTPPLVPAPGRAPGASRNFRVAARL